MKRVFITLGVCFLFILCACEENSQNGYFAEPLKAIPKSSSNTGIPRVMDAYSDGTNNYYLIDVGIISDMYISTLASVDYTGVPIDFTKTINTSETYTNSLTTTVSESITISRTDSTKIGVGLEWENKIGIGIIGSKFTVKSNFEWNWTDTNSITNSKSTSNTETIEKQYSETQTINYKFGVNTNPHGKYRYAIYGICDVYFLLKTSNNNQELLSWETLVCARPNECFMRAEYTDNRIFNNEPINTIDISENFYRSLPLPQKTIKPPEVYPDPYETDFKTIRTSTQKITHSGQFNQHFDVVSFNSYGIDLNTMKQEGYKTINFLIRLDVREIDDGYQHISLFSSANQSNNYLIASRQFEHSPGKDTTWWTHFEGELRFNNISINEFVNNQFIIRYDASGNNNDTWENKNLKIQLVFYK